MRRIDSTDDVAKGLRALARCDDRLARAIELSGPVPLRRKPPGYPALAEIVLSQMVSKASARALWRKLELAAGEISPAAILALSPGALREAGLSRAKAETLLRVGSAVLAGDLDLEHLCTLDGRAAVRAMTSIKGVGPWTAEVYLLFCAGHPDVFPSGDVGAAERGRPCSGYGSAALCKGPLGACGTVEPLARGRRSSALGLLCGRDAQGRYPH
jgi:DNA-3-methyladenine glycosylase II